MIAGWPFEPAHAQESEPGLPKPTGVCLCECVVGANVYKRSAPKYGLSCPKTGTCSVGNADGTLRNCTSEFPLKGDDDWDLVWSSLDANGLPRNPVWQWEKMGRPPIDPYFCFSSPGHPLAQHCNSQAVSYDLASGAAGVACSAYGDVEYQVIDGHVNWFDATIEGMLVWDEHSSDDDYNFHFCDSAIGAIGIEFDASETISGFETPWWTAFRQAADQGTSQGRAKLGGKAGRFAIVTGLVGLDCEHSCGNEIHPVHAMAIRVKEDPDDEEWAIFARNWGDEGFCASQQHYLDLAGRALTFRLPWWPQARQVTVASETQFLTNGVSVTGPLVNPQPGPAVGRGAVLVTFFLPQPEARAVVHGELHLHWSGTQGQALPTVAAAPPPVPSRPPAVAVLATSLPRTTGTAEDRISMAVAKLTPAQRQAYREKVQTSVVSHATPTHSASGQAAPVSAQPPRGRNVPDPRKAAHDRTRHDTLCAAFENNVPGLPRTWCTPQANR